MTFSQLQTIVSQNRDIINKIIEESENINQQQEKTLVSSVDEIAIYDLATNTTKKMKLGVLVNHISNYSTSAFISINDVEFRLLKKPSNYSVASKFTLQQGDILESGYLLDNVYILSARYENTLGDGDVTNFGTLSNGFSDGNYESVEYIEW